MMKTSFKRACMASSQTAANVLAVPCWSLFTVLVSVAIGGLAGRESDSFGTPAPKPYSSDPVFE